MGTCFNFYIFLLGCLCVSNPVSFCNLRQVNIYIYHHCYERCNYSRVRALGSPDRSLSLTMDYNAEFHLFIFLCLFEKSQGILSSFNYHVVINVMSLLIELFDEGLPWY